MKTSIDISWSTVHSNNYDSMQDLSTMNTFSPISLVQTVIEVYRVYSMKVPEPEFQDEFPEWSWEKRQSNMLLLTPPSVKITERNFKVQILNGSGSLVLWLWVGYCLHLTIFTKTHLDIQIFVFGDLFKWKSGNAGYVLLRSKAEPINAMQSSSQTQLPACFNSQGFMLVRLRRYITSFKTGLPNTKPYGHDPLSAILLLDVYEHDSEKEPR